MKLLKSISNPTGSLINAATSKKNLAKVIWTVASTAAQKEQTDSLLRQGTMPANITTNVKPSTTDWWKPAQDQQSISRDGSIESTNLENTSSYDFPNI